MTYLTISLSPNTESDDVRLAAKELLTPWRWLSGPGIAEMKQYFSDNYNTPHVFTFNSGRSALYELLKAFGIGIGDEVIIQAFTCIAVTNSIHWNGARAIYADIDDSYNLNIHTIQKVVSKKTKAIIVQHTFGIPAQIDEIVNYAKKHKILVIEDCAHALGASFNDRLLGTWGDAAFFSFGRDKVISSVFGGAAILKENCEQKVLDSMKKKQKSSRKIWILQQLLHPVAFSFILPLYGVGLGKLLLVLLQRMRLLSFPVYAEEKIGKKPDDFPSAYPPVLARLALHQLQKLDRFTANRKAVAKFYRYALSKKGIQGMALEEPGAIYLRFPIQHDDPHQLISTAKKVQVLLGNWYSSVVDPKGVTQEASGYIQGSCPVAEEKAKHIVNLPTRISLENAERIIKILLQ